MNSLEELKISIVIPSYNQGQFIESTLESIFNQRYSNLEVIVIDGGSTDETVEILKKYDDRIAYWESAPDRGQSHALNKGFKHATGDIFAWQNSDDIYVDGTFNRVVAAFRGNPSKKIVFGDYFIIDENDEPLERVNSFDFSLQHFIFEGFHLNSQALFWRSEVHQRFGEFDEELHRTMDYDMLLRFGINEGQDAFLRIDDTLACFRRHVDQKTRGFDELTEAEHMRIAQRWDTHRFERPYSYLRGVFRLRRLYWYWRRGGYHLVIQKLGERTSRGIGILPWQK